MQQFTDGTFGPIEPASDLIARLAERAPDVLDTLKAVHFGTVDELEKVRNPPAPAVIVDTLPPVDYDYMRRQIEDLTIRMNELTRQSHVQGVRVYPASVLHSLATEGK